MDMTCVYFPEQLFFECNCLHHVLAFFPRFKIIFSTFSCSALIDSSSLSLLLSTKSSSIGLLNRFLGWWSAWSIVAAQSTALFFVSPLPLNCFCSPLFGSKKFSMSFFFIKHYWIKGSSKCHFSSYHPLLEMYLMCNKHFFVFYLRDKHECI